METIKRKDGSICYREMIRIDGKAVKSPIFIRKTDAKIWKARMLGERSSHRASGKVFKSQEAVLFENFAEQWLEEIVKNERAPRTYDNYRSVIKVHLVPFFNKRTVQSIQIDDARSLAILLKEKGHNGKGVNNIIGVLKSLLRHAKSTGHLVQNPLDGLSKQKEDLRCDSYWTKSEVGQFLSSIQDQELFPLYFSALHTGLRLGELCGLKWDRINFELNQITVSRIRDRKGLRETTKSKLKRVIPIVPELKNLLLRLFQKRASHDFVFCWQDGSPVDYGHIYRQFKIDQQRSGMTTMLRFHDLRHTFASLFMMNGGNIFELQKILGHSTVEMTMRYAHFSEGHLQQASRFMSMGLNLVESEPQVNQTAIEETKNISKRREYLSVIS